MAFDPKDARINGGNGKHWRYPLDPCPVCKRDVPLGGCPHSYDETMRAIGHHLPR